MGRKLLPMEHPVGGRQHFAWLARAIRAFHADPDVRNTETFSRCLSQHLAESLKPASINRLENGDLEFNVERCIAYEKTLGLEPSLLLSTYLYVLRKDNQVPRGRHLRLREPTGADFDLIYRLGREDPIQPFEWLELSFLYRGRPDLFTNSPRLRTALFEGVLRDIGRTHEKDQRLIREAVINIGDELAPLVVHRFVEDSVRYFTAVEALGHMNGPDSWNALMALRGSLPDNWATQSILEATGRRVAMAPELFRSQETDLLFLFQQAVAILGEPEGFFYARESALNFARSLGPHLTSRQQTMLGPYRDDLKQLMVVPSGFRPHEIVHDIERRLGGILEATREQPDIPLRVPGLNHMLSTALFSPSYEDRMGLATLLAAWNRSAILTKAAGETLIRIPAEEYGTARSIVRFLTKIKSREMYPYFRKLLLTPNLEENIRLCLAWALGLGDEPGDIASLTALYRRTTTKATKRAISTAAFRRDARSLLEEIGRDPDCNVSRGAILALAELPTPRVSDAPPR